MKRAIALLAVVLLAVSLFAGCAAVAQSPVGVSLPADIEAPVTATANPSGT